MLSLKARPEVRCGQCDFPGDVEFNRSNLLRSTLFLLTLQEVQTPQFLLCHNHSDPRLWSFMFPSRFLTYQLNILSYSFPISSNYDGCKSNPQKPGLFVYRLPISIRGSISRISTALHFKTERFWWARHFFTKFITQLHASRFGLRRIIVGIVSTKQVEWRLMWC